MIRFSWWHLGGTDCSQTNKHTLERNAQKFTILHCSTWEASLPRLSHLSQAASHGSLAIPSHVASPRLVPRLGVAVAFLFGARGAVDWTAGAVALSALRSKGWELLVPAQGGDARLGRKERRKTWHKATFFSDMEISEDPRA